MTKNKKQQLIYISVAVVISIIGAVFIATRRADTSLKSSNTKLTSKFEQTTNPVIDIYKSTFMQNKVSIKKGSTVNWSNLDSIDHTVTGDNGGPSSDTIKNGEIYSYKFDTVGTFNYHCKFHPAMTAVVIVTN